MLATGPSATSGARTSRPRSTTSRRVGDDQGSQARTPRGPTSGNRADQGAAASDVPPEAGVKRYDLVEWERDDLTYRMRYAYSPRVPATRWQPAEGGVTVETVEVVLRGGVVLPVLD